jgi:hypothetical protein
MTDAQNARHFKPHESHNDARRYKAKRTADSYSVPSGQFCVPPSALH